MNLLLLLSALLSALTGVSAGARGVEPCAAVAERIVSRPVASRVAVLATRPAAALPTIGELARERVSLSPPAPGLAPFLSRRRE